MSSASGLAFRLRNPWYNCWVSARRRCEDPEHRSYRSHGAKGIKFELTKEECKTLWERDKAHLLSKASLDREDSKGNYCFSNCRFIEFIENVTRPHLEKKASVAEELQASEEPVQWTE